GLVLSQRTGGGSGEAADRLPPVRAGEQVGRRPAVGRRREHVPRVALLRRVRRVAPWSDRGRQRRHQGPLRLRLRRLPPPPPLRPHRLPLPRRRVAPQGGRARRPRAPAVPRPPPLL
ncbi:MAG: hypothetical protein AVDCRST_MAG10-3236, partial [uncultured Acidimicrobiales bacterium]